MSGRSPVPVDVYVHHKTPGAVRVSLDGEKSNAVWVPLSCIDYPAAVDIEVETEMTLDIQERMAIEKGLV